MKDEPPPLKTYRFKVGRPYQMNTCIDSRRYFSFLRIARRLPDCIDFHQAFFFLRQDVLRWTPSTFLNTTSFSLFSVHQSTNCFVVLCKHLTIKFTEKETSVPSRSYKKASIHLPIIKIIENRWSTYFATICPCVKTTKSLAFHQTKTFQATDIRYSSLKRFIQYTFFQNRSCISIYFC